jgi:glycosyltransferase involved in cell wall biosynthesis
MLQLTIWMNYPALYQGDLFRALISSGEVDLQVIFAKAITNERVSLGWENDIARYSSLFLPKSHRTAHAVRLAWSHRDRLHIVNGIWTDPSFSAALAQLSVAGSTFAIYSEAPDPTLDRALSKRLLQAGFGKAIARRASGALSVSEMAAEFYRRLGMRENTIYPFGYFTGVRDSEAIERKPGRIEVIFAGQIIYRKGVDLLIEAMIPLFHHRPDVFLTIIGSGEMVPDLSDRLTSAAVGERASFEGVLSPENIPARIAKADVLVLPSRWDGWGVVVNEAFSVGVPVIVSDRCGAADLIQNGVNGFVFRSEDGSDLLRCLNEFLDRENEWSSFRSNAAETGRRILADSVAPYLIECLKHMSGVVKDKPIPPWNAQFNGVQGPCPQ